MATTKKLSGPGIAGNMFEQVVNDEAIAKIVAEYTGQYPDASVAAKKFIKDHAKQTTYIALIEQITSHTKLPELAGSGLGFIGIVGYQLYIVAGVAAIAGKDIHSNEVRTQCIESITVNVAARALRPVASKATELILKKYKIGGVEKLVDSTMEFVLDWSAIQLVGRISYKHFFGKKNCK